MKNKRRSTGFKAKIKEFNEKWQRATTVFEMAKLRDEFFALPFDYERLDRAWDLVEREEVKVSNRIDLPLDEIVELAESGLSNNKIAEIFSTSYHTIQRRLLQYYEGGKEC